MTDSQAVISEIFFSKGSTLLVPMLFAIIFLFVGYDPFSFTKCSSGCEFFHINGKNEFNYDSLNSIHSTYSSLNSLSISMIFISIFLGIFYIIPVVLKSKVGIFVFKLFGFISLSVFCWSIVARQLIVLKMNYFICKDIYISENFCSGIIPFSYRESGFDIKIEVDWYFLWVSLLSGVITLFFVVRNLIKKSKYEDDDSEIETGFITWGRSIYYRFTLKSFLTSRVFTTILQIIYIAMVTVLIIICVIDSLTMLAWVLFLLLLSYVFLLFNGLRDSLLLYKLNSYSDVTDFIEKIKVYEPKMAYYEETSKVISGTLYFGKKLVPLNIIWADYTDVGYTHFNDVSKPIIEICIKELWYDVRTDEYSPLVEIKPEDLKKQFKYVSSQQLILVKSDLQNYYIYKDSTNKPKFNRLIQAIITLLGLSGLYSIYLNQFYIHPNKQVEIKTGVGLPLNPIQSN